MTQSQITAEYILQQIKTNDLIEVTLENNEKVKGYVLDSDVFQGNYLDPLLSLHAKASNQTHNPILHITLRPLEAKPKDPIDLGIGISLSNLQFHDPFIKILVSRINEIKKL